MSTTNNEVTFDFTGKVSVVTGAGGGIGQACAGSCRRQRGGHRHRLKRRRGRRPRHQGARWRGDCMQGRRRRSRFSGSDGCLRRRDLRRHRSPGQQCSHLRRHGDRHAAQRRLGLPHEVPGGEPARRSHLHESRLPLDAKAGRRRDRQPVVDRCLPLLELLRFGEVAG